MTPIETTAWLILATSAAALGFYAFRQFVAIQRDGDIFRRETKLFDERLEGIRFSKAKAKNDTAPWNGTRKFQVYRKEQEKGGICSFYLKPHDDKLPLPTFKPGQFLTFDLVINGEKISRSYSLSEAPKNDYYRVSIKRCLAPREPANLPPGIVSSYFHDEIHEDAILDIKAPNGGFYVDMDPSETGPIVLSGAGVGLTPVLSMMNALVEADSKRVAWFFYGVRDGSENMIVDKIKEWRALNKENFHIHVCYSRPSPDDVQGEDYDHKSRVSPELLKSQLDSNNYNFYTCGPGPMMEGIRDCLSMWGVPDEDVHDEAFIAVRKAVKVSDSTVEFKNTNKTVEVSGEITTLLDLAESNSVKIPWSCKVGALGCCQTAILDGKVKYVKPHGFKTEKGCCLPCVCIPDGNLVLDA